MEAPVLEVEPQELRFTFELKKQITFSIQLRNNSDDYVAFKVKTTSPKKYCVRSNVGIVPPKSSSDFLAYNSSRLDMQRQILDPMQWFLIIQLKQTSHLACFPNRTEDMLKVQRFPLLYVVMVVMIGMMLGFLLRSSR